MFSNLIVLHLLILSALCRVEVSEKRFDPCSIRYSFSAEQTAGVVSVVKKFVKTCAFGIINKNKVFLTKESLLLLPTFPRKICLFHIAIFNYMTDTNCLPAAIKKNGSLYYEQAKRFSKVLERDSSVKKSFCYKNKCIKKQDVMPIFDDWLRCFQKANDGRMMGCWEEVVLVCTKTMDMVVKSGIYRYFVG